MPKGFYKIIGNKPAKENITVQVTTWDGSKPVMVITPKKPTKEEKQETIDFILHELDDHNGYNEYISRLKEIEKEENGGR